jgi:sigma-B regulation protein RsbU (phosphoserine phosphatase)
MYSWINSNVVEPIARIQNSALGFVESSHGKSDPDEIEFVDPQVHTNNELQLLSESIGTMANDLKTFMHNLIRETKERERIGTELQVATQIQADMLPRIFPAFPARKEFDLFASMTPAKEVGGDFYDFFLVDEDHLALVMADVSGKGVPAALFMVIAKTLIKNAAQTGRYPGEVLSYVNDQLCEGNEAGLFVTVWIAIIEISTGKGKSANAGHEHPALRRADGSWELIKYRHSPAVATMEGMRFREREFELHPGDSLFVYTDGVAEATNADNVLYGSDRMVDALNKEPMASPEQLLKNIKEDVDLFVAEAPQFDDLTMLALTWKGSD